MRIVIAIQLEGRGAVEGELMKPAEAEDVEPTKELKAQAAAKTEQPALLGSAH